MSRSRSLAWLRDLASVAESLPVEREPTAYYSRRKTSSQMDSSSLALIVRQTRSLIQDLNDQHYSANTLGFSCEIGDGRSGSSPEYELEQRVDKSHLWLADPESWTEPDLCDFIEVLHDLSARPATGWHCDYEDCGWHPTTFSRASGQALYRWRVNRLLDQTAFGYRLANAGEDMGRMVRVMSGELGRLIDEMLDIEGESETEVSHAIALFRDRDESREKKRSAVVALAGILEERRDILKKQPLTDAEKALFEIANKFELRHRRSDQQGDYGTEFLEWFFYWYLATVQLTDRLVTRRPRMGSADDVE